MKKLMYIFGMLALLLFVVACDDLETKTPADTPGTTKDESTVDITVDNWDPEHPFFYTSEGKKEYFSIRKDQVILKAASAVDAEALCREDVFLSAKISRNQWIRASVDAKNTELDDLLKLSGVLDASYVLEYGNGVLHYVRDEIFVKPSGISVEKIFKKTGLSKNIVAIELFDKYNNIYLISLDMKSGDILPLCCGLYESGLCIFAEPNFFIEMPVF